MTAQNDLMTILKFAQEDLQANRDHQISAAQRTRLVQQAADVMRGGWLFMGAITVIVVGLNLLSLYPLSLAVNVVILGVAYAAIATVMVLGKRRSDKALATPEVAVVAGEIVLSGPDEPCLLLDERRFPVSKSQRQRLVKWSRRYPSQRCDAYYLPHTGALLSVETVPEPGAPDP